MGGMDRLIITFLGILLFFLFKLLISIAFGFILSDGEVIIMLLFGQNPYHLMA
jgi:hypothetical protein